jgi:hypothetical protein
MIWSTDRDDVMHDSVRQQVAADFLSREVDLR